MFILLLKVSLFYIFLLFFPYYYKYLCGAFLAKFIIDLLKNDT